VTDPPCEYDAVVVGSGLGGATLAYRLSKCGLRVLVLERGDYLPNAERLTSPYGPYKSLSPEPSLVGGPTKFYGAAMYRLRESDFNAVQHEAGESPAWPITYHDLEPYYAEAESLYRVHGHTGDDPTEPPRSAPLPHPALPHTTLVSTVVDRLRHSGTCVSSMPRAIDYGPNGKCTFCATCDGYYCHLDAKMDADVAALRPALATGLVRVVTRATCIRVTTTDDGTRATGVVFSSDASTKTIRAKAVAICAGVPNSARLLIESRTVKHPRGLGNSTGCVGRYYAGHTAGMIFPLIGLSRLPAMHTKTFAINTYYHGAPGWSFPMGVIQSAGQMPFWQGTAVPQWKKPLAKLIGDRSLYCFYMTEAIPTRETGFDFTADRAIERMKPPLENHETFKKLRALAIEAFRRAGYPVVAPGFRSLWHTVGTVRFGSDPHTSVTDRNCKIHDIDNLYVVDASTLPSAGAVNTGLTIAALALRAGDAIATITGHLRAR